MSSKRIFYLLLSATLVFTGCAKEKKSEGTAGQLSQEEAVVREIVSSDQFNTLVNTTERKLLVFDLYADWCMPCRILSPMLEEIAGEYKGRALFYKINIDKNREIAAFFRVTGIPLVVFMKDKQVLNGLVGVQSREQYLQLVNQYLIVPADQVEK